jgi:hypothetical protein
LSPDIDASQHRNIRWHDFATDKKALYTRSCP